MFVHHTVADFDSFSPLNANGYPMDPAIAWTPSYAAPETVILGYRNPRATSAPTDMWQFGMSILALAIGTNVLDDNVSSVDIVDTTLVVEVDHHFPLSD